MINKFLSVIFNKMCLQIIYAYITFVGMFEYYLDSQ